MNKMKVYVEVWGSECTLESGTCDHDNTAWIHVHKTKKDCITGVHNLRLVTKEEAALWILRGAFISLYCWEIGTEPDWIRDLTKPNA